MSKQRGNKKKSFKRRYKTMSFKFRTRNKKNTEVIVSKYAFITAFGSIQTIPCY